MNNNSRFILILSVVFVFLSACSSTQHSKRSSSKAETENKPRTQEEVNSTSSLLMARRHLLNGDRDLAYESLKKAVHQNPNNDAAYFEISRLAQYSKSTKALNKALEYGEKAVDIDPNNVWYHKNLIAIYKRQNNFEDAAKEAQKIIDIEPNTVEHYYQLANMYIYDEDYKSALKVYAKVEDRFGYSSGVILQRKQIYLKLGSYQKAIHEIDKLIAHEPEVKEYYGMQADIYMAMGSFDKAYEALLKIQEIDPTDGRVHLVFADYYRAKGNEAQSFKEVKTALGSLNLETDTKIEVLLKYYTAGENNKKTLSQANELMDTVLQVNPKDAKVLALKADLLNKAGNYKEALVYFKKVIAVDSSLYLVWEQMLLVEQRLGNFESMADESDRALRLFPQQPGLYFFSGFANIEIKEYAKAKEHLKMGLNFVFDKKYKSEFYGLLGESEFRLHEYGPAEDHFDRAVKGNPLNARALKDYAYFLAYNNKNLSKAKNMATSAYEMRSHDADYIYTYAYVLFKSGEVQQAKKWISDGMRQFPNNKKLQLLNQEVNKNE